MQPSEIRLSTDKRVLQVVWGENTAALPAEYLRVESPSAEVKGHGIGQAKLVSGKRNVTISGVEPVGSYAVKLVFSDGHSTGLYTWNYLKELAEAQAERWDAYVRELAAAGLSRDVSGAVVLRKGLGV
jgi:DUF971 family protein